MNIYFDNAATTPALPFPVYKPMGNPSSPHKLGLKTERKLSNARDDIAKILNCLPSEIIFTSGGTEANNLALLGFALAHQRKNITFLTQTWEHPSIIEPLKFIKEQGLGNLIIAPHQDWTNFNAPTLFAAISHVNNETGDIYDVAAIAQELKARNPNTVVLVDGVQGFSKEPVNLTNIDMYSFSAHKCHGPTGIGGLMVKKNIRLTPLFHGGGQEHNIRSGTENIAGILHMTEVAKNIRPINPEVKSTLAELINELPDVCINQQTDTASDYILNISFLGARGEPLVHMLSEQGIYASMGAACRSRKNTKTTLESMGFSAERANSAVRFSFSHLNTIEEAKQAKEIIKDSVAQLRRMLNPGGSKWK